MVDATLDSIAEAVEGGANLIVAHHPLLLRGVTTVAESTYKGRVIADLIRGGVALYSAHTNADVVPSKPP
jgi:putative NIF3 family GTP cyclohydrolase 1 type 2